MAATSKALACRLILDAIFEVLSPGQIEQHDFASYSEAGVHRRLAQRTLARAARVCHAFEVPALNVLWRVVDDIVDLLSILPSLGGYPYVRAVLSQLDILIVTGNDRRSRGISR